MAISLNEIAQQSGAAFDQISNYSINWGLVSIAIAVVGCWLAAEFIEFFEDRERMRRRFARPLA
jgi:putative Mn2+ efflux pump MntP